MIKSGILNPALNSLISRFRHTNLLVIADRGFPFWPEIETIDISLADDIPRVLDVLRAVTERCMVGRIYMAEEFLGANTIGMQSDFAEVFGDIPIVYEAHDQFKTRVPQAVGLIRTGDTIQYANMILESA